MSALHARRVDDIVQALEAARLRLQAAAWPRPSAPTAQLTLEVEADQEADHGDR